MRFASSSSATEGTGRRLGPASTGNLSLRVASALVLGPIVLCVVYFGPPYFDVVAAIVAVVAAWEWVRLCGHREISRAGALVIGTVSAAMMAAILREYAIAGWIVAAGAMASAVLATREDRGKSFWYALGILYAALPCLGLVWLRGLEAQGREIVFWLLLVVWATDTGAYAAGRTIGGPKLAPRMSPKKTWAGLAGGVLAAALVGVATALLLADLNLLTMATASALLALVSQAGDLFESSVKRRFDAKDSSNLIPGHGGLLDRVDGVFFAGLAVAAIISMRGASL